MKKIIFFLMAVIMSMSLVACGGKQSDGSADSSEKKEEATLKAEKKILNVEVTIPAGFFDDADTTLDEEAKQAGVKEIIKNDDGSITMKMSKSAHEKLLKEFKNSVDESIEETLGDKENYPSIDAITYNDDLTEFNVNVDANSYGGFESLVSMVFYFEGNIYQAINAVSSEELQTVVNFVNKDTGEVIESGNSKDMEDSEGNMEN